MPFPSRLRTRSDGRSVGGCGAGNGIAPNKMKLSLARLCLIAFVILELAVSVAIFFLYQSEEDLTGRGLRSGVQEAGHALAGDIVGLAGRLRDLARRIAKHPQTIASLAGGSEQQRLAQLSNIEALYPNVTIHLIPAAASEAAGLYSAPVSAVHVQLPAAGGGDSRRRSDGTLSIVQPVTDPHSGSLLGFVLVDRREAELRALFNRLPFKGDYAELQQFSVSGPYQVVLRGGDPSLKTGSRKEWFDLPGTTWRLVVWPRPSWAQRAGEPYKLHLWAWLFVSTWLALAIGGLYFAMRKTLSGDVETLLAFFSDIRHFRLRKSYNIRLKDLQPSFDLMYGLGKLMVGKQRQVADYASIDHLSQVHNRRSFETKQRELYKTLADGWVHSLLILDIDNFKQVNDTYGHDAGDTLIVQFGKALRENLRSSDFVARLGGDEFCVIFPNTPLKKAAELAARLRQSMPAEVTLAPGVMHRLNWSGGLSEYKREDRSENMALSRADGALLEAKRAGRNQTRVAA